MKSSRKMLQNLPYFWNMKIHVVFFVFHFMLLYFFPNECPGLCRHRPGHSLGEKIKLHKMKIGKTTLGFRIHKIWQILKHFAGVLKVENKFVNK